MTSADRPIPADVTGALTPSRVQVQPLYKDKPPLDNAQIPEKPAPAHMAFMKPGTGSNNKDTYNTALGIDSRGEMEMQFRVDIGLLRVLLTDKGIPPNKIDTRIQMQANTLSNWQSMTEQKRKRAYDTLDKEINGKAIKGFSTYLGIYAAFSESDAVGILRDTFNSTPQDTEAGLKIRISLARTVLTKADSFLTKNIAEELERFKKALEKQGLSEKEIRFKAQAYEGIGQLPSPARLSRLSLLRNEIAELNIPDESNSASAKQVGEPLSRGQVESRARNVEIKNRLGGDKKVLLHMIANLPLEDPTTVPKGVLSDIRRFDQLPPAKKAEATEAIISTIHMLAIKSVDRYLNIYDTFGERQRGSALKYEFDQKTAGAFDQGQAARGIIEGAIELINSKHEAILGSLNTVQEDIGGQASDDVSQRIWRILPDNIDEAVEQIEILQEMYGEALLSAFPIYARIWDRLNRYNNPNNTDLRYKDTGGGIIAIMERISNPKDKIRKAEALAKKIDASFEVWNKKLRNGLSAQEQRALGISLTSGPRTQRLRVLGRLLRK